jgi:hypothetical protein
MKGTNGRACPYAEKLKDPRWQKKRLEVFQRDNFTCRRCYDNSKTLHCHHLYYDPRKDPWDYSLQFLMTLCEECHQEETERREFQEQRLLNVLRWTGVMSWHLEELSDALVASERGGGICGTGAKPFQGVIAAPYWEEICWAISDAEGFIALRDARAKYLKEWFEARGKEDGHVPVV